MDHLKKKEPHYEVAGTQGGELMAGDEFAPIQLGEYRSSRWAAPLVVSLTAIIWPWTFYLGREAIDTAKRKSLFFPWVRETERMKYTSIASVRHRSGLIWDSITVETRGGSNNLDIRGLKKCDATKLVEALRAVTES